MCKHAQAYESVDFTGMCVAYTDSIGTLYIGTPGKAGKDGKAGAPGEAGKGGEIGKPGKQGPKGAPGAVHACVPGCVCAYISGCRAYMPSCSHACMPACLHARMHGISLSPCGLGDYATRVVRVMRKIHQFNARMPSCLHAW